MATSQKVNSGLRAEGLIYTEPGMGSFVAKNAAEILREAERPAADDD